MTKQRENPPEKTEIEQDIDKFEQDSRMEEASLFLGKLQDPFSDPAKAECLRQAKWSFNLALVFGALGIAVILIGGILVFTTEMSSGKVTTLAGAIPGVISALLFELSRRANKRLKDITEKSDDLNEFHYVMNHVYRINSEERDTVIADLAKRFLGRQSPIPKAGTDKDKEEEKVDE